MRVPKLPKGSLIVCNSGSTWRTLTDYGPGIEYVGGLINLDPNFRVLPKYDIFGDGKDYSWVVKIIVIHKFMEYYH